MKRRRLVLDVEKLSIQCKDLPWYQYWLSVEEMENVTKLSSLEVCRIGTNRP